MGTRIDVQVGQALLGQRLRDLAALNREQRIDREQKVRQANAVEDALDAMAANDAQKGRPQNNTIDWNLSPEQYEDRLRSQGRKSGVPDYYTAPKVAVSPQQGGAGVGNGWLWATSKITKVDFYGDFLLTTGPSTNAGVTGLEQQTKLGSLDGTRWLEWTDSFSATAPTPGGALPLPSSIGTSHDFVRHDQALSPHIFTRADNYSLTTRRLVLPVGPRAFIYVVVKRCVFAFQPCTRTIYVKSGVTYPSGVPTENVEVFSLGASLTTSTVSIKKAFFVGKSTVREISLPSALEADLDDLTPTAVPTLPNASYFFSDLTGPRQFLGENQGTFSVPRLTWTTTPAVNSDNAWLTTNGFGAPRLERLANNNTIPNLDLLTGGASTAAVYPLLKHGSAWESSNLDPEAVSVKAKAVNVGPVNDGAFGTMGDYDPASSIGYDPFRSVTWRQPIDYLYATGGNLLYNANGRLITNPLSPSRMTRTEANPTTYAYSDDEGYAREGVWQSGILTSYDWMKSSFCRKRLIELGFAAADLRP